MHNAQTKILDQDGYGLLTSNSQPMQTFTLFNSSVATSFSGGIYLDFPTAGRVTHVLFSLEGLSAAAAASEMTSELATGTVDQYSGGSGKNIIAMWCNCGTSGTKIASNGVVPVGVQVRAGERWYLNAKNGATNWQDHRASCTIYLA